MMPSSWAHYLHYWVWHYSASQLKYNTQQYL